LALRPRISLNAGYKLLILCYATPRSIEIIARHLDAKRMNVASKVASLYVQVAVGRRLGAQRREMILAPVLEPQLH